MIQLQYYTSCGRDASGQRAFADRVADVLWSISASPRSKIAQRMAAHGEAAVERDADDRRRWLAGRFGGQRAYPRSPGIGRTATPAADRNWRIRAACSTRCSGRPPRVTP
jgi:hypothetical protein